MENQNYIHVFVPSSLGFRLAGAMAVPIPQDGIPPELVPVLARYTGLKQPAHQQYTLTLNTMPTWDAVIAAAQELRAQAMIAAQEEEDRKAKDAARAATENEQIITALKNADLTHEYPQHSCGNYLMLASGQSARATSEGAISMLATWAKQRAEYVARIQVEQNQKEQEARREVVAKQYQARRLFVAANMPDEAYQRFLADVLAVDELQAAWSESVTPKIELPRYKLRQVDDVVTCDCDPEVKSWERKPLGNLPAMTAEQFARWQIFVKWQEGNPDATIQVDQREACLSCRCPDPCWYTVRVVIEDQNLGLSTKFVYEL
jgi:hypothetical protein